MLKCWESKTMVICLKLRAKLRIWGFLSVFGTFSLKEDQTWFVATKLGTQHYLVYIILLQRWKSKTIVICLKLRVKLRVWDFLSVFGTFTHKVVQTWFVLHETLHYTFFGIYYCVEIVRIENNSHMLEITWYVAFLSFFGTFSHKVV